MDNNRICTTELAWQPEVKYKVGRLNNWEKDGRDRKIQNRDEQLGKGRDNSQIQRQMEVFQQVSLRHRA